MPIDTRCSEQHCCARRAQTPSNVALRLHLAELLLEDGQATQALSHLSLVLASRPDDV
jgi:thioredoxin-like negative regulator of GroEL